MPDRIRAVFTAGGLTVEADASGERRTIAGVAVPYGEVGRTMVGPVRFLAGSLEPAATITANRDHDQARLVGRVVQHTAGAAGAAAVNARVRVSATALGDETLTLADDGTVAGFSIEADPIEYAYVADPVHGQVLEVAHASWTGLALVPRPAFTGAAIATVAAAEAPPDDDDEGDEGDEPPDDETAEGADRANPVDALNEPPDAADPDPDSDDQDEDEDEDTDTEHEEGTRPMPASNTLAPTVPAIAAAEAPAVIPVHAAPSAAPLDLRRVAGIIATAQGDPAQIRAALTNITTTTAAGLVRPQYVDDLTGLIDAGRPAVEAFRSRDLTSNPIMHPHWATLGAVDVQAAEKTQVASAAAELEWVTIPAKTYAGANDLSVQLVDWGTPSAIETYLQMMAVVYGRKTEADFEAALVAAAVDVPAAGGDIIGDLGGAIGTVASTGLVPDLILTSGDVFGFLWAQLAAIGPGLFSAVNAGFPTPRVVLMPFAPPATLIVGSSEAAVTYERSGAPVEIRAVDVSLLGIDLGVYGYFAWAVDVPGALVQITTPLAPPFAASSAAKR